MKKQGMLDAIQSKFASVLSIREVEQIGNVKWYVVNVLDAAGDCATKRNVGFYVVDEGKAAEKAYWHGSEPKPPAPVKSFQQLLQEHIGELVAAGTIEGGRVGAVDAISKTAVVTVWLVSGANIEAKTFFIDEDAGSWRRREIVSI